MPVKTTKESVLRRLCAADVICGCINNEAEILKAKPIYANHYMAQWLLEMTIDVAERIWIHHDSPVANLGKAVAEALQLQKDLAKKIGHDWVYDSDCARRGLQRCVAMVSFLIQPRGLLLTPDRKKQWRREVVHLIQALKRKV